MKRSVKIITTSLCTAVFSAGTAIFTACSDKTTDNVPPTPSAECEHSSVSRIVALDATCTDTGFEKSVCNVCGEVVAVETVTALEHDYATDYNVVKSPTESAEGERIKVCAFDGAHYLSDTVPRLSGEDYSVTITPASCAAVGKTVYASSEYGEFTVYSPKLAHDYTAAQSTGKCSVCGEKISSLGLGFTLNSRGDGYIVNKTANYADVDLVIPAEYNGLPVTEIASEAFAEWKWITSVTIPESIKTIGAGAFSQMSGISTVRFNAVMCDDLNGRNWAFYPSVDGSSKPINLIVGSAVQRIPSRLFYPLATEPNTISALSEITFEEGSVLKSIGEYAFYRTALNGVNLPESLECIEQYAFYGTRITSLEIGENLTVLGNGAFGACEMLESAAFGRKLETIGDDCFNYCVKLDSAELGATAVRNIGTDAFKNCAELKTVSFPYTLERIGNSAYCDCVKLEAVRLGDALATIGERAFYGCSSLKHAVIPEDTTEIGNGAFENCTELKSVDYRAVSASDLPQGNRVFAGAGTDGGITVAVRSCVRSLPARLFFSSSDAEKNTTIDTLVIERGVNTVGDYAFYGCSVNDPIYLGTAEQYNVTVGKNNTVLDGMIFKETI